MFQDGLWVILGYDSQPAQGKITNLLPFKQIDGFKDAFDDLVCKDSKLQKTVINRSNRFIQPINANDEVVSWYLHSERITD